MKELNKQEYHVFYQTYIDQINKNELGIIGNLEDSLSQAIDLFDNLEENKHIYQYALDKWTIKELIQHLSDAERVFNYRAMRIARKDPTNLAGFEQNDYVLHSNANERSFQDLKEEFFLLRKNTILLYQSFTDRMLSETGKVSSNIMSVRALGFITSGHLLHHIHIIKTRYL